VQPAANDNFVAAAAAAAVAPVRLLPRRLPILVFTSLAVFCHIPIARHATDCECHELDLWLYVEGIQMPVLIEIFHRN